MASSVGGRPSGAFDGHGVDVHLHFVLFRFAGDFGGRDVVGFVVDDVPLACCVLVEAIDVALEVTIGRPGEEEFGFAVQDGRLGQLFRARRTGEALDQFGGGRRQPARHEEGHARGPIVRTSGGSRRIWR